MPKKFRALPERTVVLPQGLQAGPGATNMRLNPGQVVTLEDDSLAKFGRWVNGRVHAGDLEEVALNSPDESEAPTPVPSAARAGKDDAPRMGIELGKPADGKDKP